MSGSTLKNGNNVPLHAPLFEDPFVPYRCPGNTTLSVYCRGDRRNLEAHLAHTPFELASDTFLVYISDFTKCDKVAFMDAGIMLPIVYRGRNGGYVLYEYENDDAAMAAGRELWGYPKKYADIRLETAGDRVSGSVERKGTRIFEIEALLADPVEPPSIKLNPHFNIKITPAPYGGVEAKKIIERDTSPDFVTTSLRTGTGKARLTGHSADPFALLGDFESLAASFVVGDFLASETHGWGRVVETL